MHKISKPSKEDIPEVVALLKFVVEDTFKKDLILDEKGLITEIDFLCNSFIHSFEDETNHYLISHLDSKIVGVISYGDINRIIEKNANLDITQTVEIKSAYIHPKFQNKGIGSSLFKEIIKQIKQTNFSSYCLDSGYKAAQVFWKNILGKPKMVLKDYWGDSLDHHIWIVKV